MRRLKNNIYTDGGSMKDLYDFLFDEDDDSPASAPSEDEIPEQYRASETLSSPDEYNNTLQMAMQMGMFDRSNEDPFFNQKKVQSAPHGSEYAASIGEAYTGQILSSGQYGAQHVGEFGKKIYGELATDLGYAPVANSIYRDPGQQAALIKQGYGAKNSYHLTGNAVDIKPADWKRLSSQQQKKYRNEYDVLFHNNHYHLEPK